jgi:hypothetical protein
MESKTAKKRRECAEKVRQGKWRHFKNYGNEDSTTSAAESTDHLGDQGTVAVRGTEDMPLSERNPNQRMKRRRNDAAAVKILPKRRKTPKSGRNIDNSTGDPILLNDFEWVSDGE